MQKLYIVFVICAITSLLFTFLYEKETYVEQSQGGIQCKNSNNQSVDWYVMLKLPKNYNDGKAFYYIDNTLNEFQYQNDVNDRSSPLMNTLAQIQNVSSQDQASVFWTDQPNNENASGVYAHSKGVLGADKEQGFIINHTTPRFPVITEDNQIELEIDGSQLKYGQHFLCFSADSENLDKYADGLQLDRVFPFRESNVPEELDMYLHNFTTLLEKKQKKGTFDIINIETLGKQQITKFAKSGKWVESFYDQVVSTNYEQEFIFETWARPLSEADCDSEHRVVSNLAVKYSDEVQYSYTKDHSKFGISVQEDIVCFGDINRQNSQFKRGGGTNCFRNQIIHDFLKQAFVEQQEC